LLEGLVDAVGEGVLALIACGVVVFVGFGMVTAPWLTLSVLIPFLFVAVYGLVELARSTKQPKWKWRGLAVGGLVTAAVVGSLVVYAVAFCGCLG
jgi:hypothetical protein